MPSGGPRVAFPEHGAVDGAWLGGCGSKGTDWLIAYLVDFLECTFLHLLYVLRIISIDFI